MSEYHDWELQYAKKYGNEAIKQISEGDVFYASLAAQLAAKHAMNGLSMREMPFPVKVNDGRR